jgi:hypothetical protein
MLEAYAQDRADVAMAFSIEAHLEACESCRHNVATFVPSARLDRIWGAVSDTIAEPQRGVVERGLMFLGVKDHIARLLAATPALRLSWFAAIFVVLSIAIIVAYGADNGYVLFLMLAPLLPVAGVALSYGPAIDPTYEIGIAAPMRSFRLLLIRTVAVVTSTVATAVIAALLLPDVRWGAAAAWLLPALGLAAATLALSTFIRQLPAAGLVAFTWIASTGTVLWSASEGALTIPDVFGAAMQVPALVVMLGSMVVLAARQGAFEKGEEL